MAGESLTYQILYDGGKLSKYLVEGSITLTPDISINYEVSWNLSVKTKKNSSIIDTFSSDEEDENFTISGQSPDEIIKNQFQDLIEDAIDSKFSELNLKENKFSYKSPSNSESPKDQARRHFFQTYGQPKENQYIGEGLSIDQTTSEKKSQYNSFDNFTLDTLPTGYKYSSSPSAITIHRHVYGLPNNTNIKNYLTIGIYEFTPTQIVKSKIVDRDTKEPVVGATIQTNEGESTKTDKNGDFEIKLKIPQIPIPTEEMNSSFLSNSSAEDALLTSKSGASIKQDTPKEMADALVLDDYDKEKSLEAAKVTNQPKKLEIKPAKIIITSKSHEQHTITPVTLDGNVREEMGVIPVISNEVAMEETKRKELLLPEVKIKAFQQSKTDSDMRKQIAMNKMISHIKTVLLPQALLLIAAFGISKAQGFLGKKFGDMNAACPASLKDLNKLIKRKNKLTKRLNNIYKFLERIETGVNIVDKLILAAQIAVDIGSAASILPFLPLPVIPPIPTPPSVSNKLEKAKRDLAALKLLSSSVLLILEVITDLLLKILNYLNMLDSLIQGCTEEYLKENPEDEARIQSQVDNQLMNALIERLESEEEEEVIKSREYKGFTFKVESINTSEVNGLQRRRALALNPQGITMLKGEPSFSSNDNILIDELKFYINQNDLKAE
tara:strand:- start:17450 stop:19450 length:2001 start_codon:yes stop_codon:yes gene_type:complete